MVGAIPRTDLAVVGHDDDHEEVVVVAREEEEGLDEEEVDRGHEEDPVKGLC